jgi:peptidylprolyl isomerase
MKIDEIKNITISSDEWYWKYNEDNTQTVDKSSLKSFVDAGIVLEAWNVLPTPQGDFKILSTTDTEVIIDTNHPLAWKELVFKIELIDFVD